MKFLTLEGGTYNEVDLSTYDGVIVAGNATVDSWSGAAGKAMTIQNGATLTTAAWNTFAVKVDLTGSSATGGNAWNAIDYTGTGSVTYGFITVTGGTRAGGYALDNDLFIGNYVYYNDPSYSSDTTSAVINGATFAVVYGGTDYTTANATAYSFSAENVKQPNNWSGITKQFCEEDPIVIYTGSGYKPTTDAKETDLFSDTLFQSVNFVTGNNSYGVHLVCGAGDVCTVIRDTAFALTPIYTLYNSNDVGNAYVSLENCTFENFNGVRSRGTTSGNYSVSLINCRKSDNVRSSTIRMGGNPYVIGGNMLLNLENVLCSTVTNGKSNNIGEAIVYGDSEVTITGSTISSLFVVNQVASASALSTASTVADVIHFYGGTVAVELSGSTVTTAVYLPQADVTATHQKTEKELFSTNVLDKDLVVTAKDHSVIKQIKEVAGGTINQDLRVELQASTVTDTTTLLDGGTVGRDVHFKVTDGSYCGSSTYLVKSGSSIGGNLLVDISGSSINGKITALTGGTSTVAVAGATVSLSGSSFANAVRIAENSTLDHVVFSADNVYFRSTNTLLTGSTVTGDLAFDFTNVYTAVGKTLTLVSACDVGGDITVNVSGGTYDKFYGLYGAKNDYPSVGGTVSMSFSNAEFESIVASTYTNIEGDLNIDLTNVTSNSVISLAAQGGTVKGNITAKLTNVSSKQELTYTTKAKAKNTKINLELYGTNNIGTNVVDGTASYLFDNILVNPGATLDFNGVKYYRSQKVTVDGTGFTGVVWHAVTSDRSDQLEYNINCAKVVNNKDLAVYQDKAGFNITVYQYKNHDLVYVNSEWENQTKLAVVNVEGGTAYYQANAWANVGEALKASAAGGTIALAGGEVAEFDDATRYIKVIADTTVTGALTAASVTIDAARTLTAGANITTSAFANSGTLELANDLTLTITADSTLGEISGAHTLMVDATKVTGVSYTTAFKLVDGAKIAGGFVQDNTLYYYCVVDSNISGEIGTEVNVTINGVLTKAIIGNNAFTSTAAAKAAHADATIVSVNETIEGGDLGGGTSVLESGVKITGTLYGAGESADYVDLTLNGASSSKTVLGGGNSLGGTVGNVSLTLTDATVDGFVYGGGQSGVTGKITTSITGETKLAKNFYGGNLISDSTEGGSYTAGAISVNVTGGSFGGNFIGGSRVNGSGITSEDTLKETVASVALSISGGEFQKNSAIFSGGYVLGNGSADKTLLEITNGVTLTLKNTAIGLGTASGAIGVYGGALAGNFGTSVVRKGSAANAVAITVESGYYSSVFGGGWAENGGKSSVSGNIAINVTGGTIGSLFAGGNNDTSGATADVSCEEVVMTLSGCTVNNVYAASKWATSKITGNTEVNITGTVVGLDILSGKTSSGSDAVSGTQTLDLDASVSCGTVNGFDIWEVASNATLTAAKAIDLNNVTLKLDAAAWTVATGSAIDNLASAAGVTIGDAKATYADGIWSTDAWQLSVSKDEKSLILAAK